MMKTNVFSQRIEGLRKAKKLSAEKLSKKLHMPLSVYQAYELGATMPNLIITYKLAEYFGVSMDYLVGRTNASDLFTGHQYTKTESGVTIWR